jgi:hypothetical protein
LNKTKGCLIANFATVPCIPKSRLAESVSKVNELARPQNNNFHDEMVEQYGRVKRFLPAVLRDLHFQAAPAGELRCPPFII